MAISLASLDYMNVTRLPVLQTHCSLLPEPLPRKFFLASNHHVLLVRRRHLKHLELFSSMELTDEEVALFSQPFPQFSISHFFRGNYCQVHEDLKLAFLHANFYALDLMSNCQQRTMEVYGPIALSRMKHENHFGALRRYSHKLKLEPIGARACQKFQREGIFFSCSDHRACKSL